MPNSIIRTHYGRKAIASIFLVSIAFFALAITGGGSKSKKAQNNFGFVSVKTTNGFTLKSGPNYKGSFALTKSKTSTGTSYTSLITYQQGNTTFIMPYKYKVNNNQAPKSNMQLVNLKMKIRK